MRITLRQQRVAHALDRQTGRALAVPTAFASSREERGRAMLTDLLQMRADCSAEAFASIV
jgi:hypothetical protein